MRTLAPRINRLLPAGLVLLILAIAFPLQWALTKADPWLKNLVKPLINAVWLHVVLHLLLFALLAAAAAWLLQRWRQPFPFNRILTIILAVAFIQEGLQMLPYQRCLGPDEIFDFIIDICGGMAGYALFLFAHKLRKTMIFRWP